MRSKMTKKKKEEDKYTEFRMCRWCNDQKDCLNLDVVSSDGEDFKMPVCKRCLLTSTEYEYLSYRYEK